MMTIEQLTAAFNYKYTLCTNTRNFSRDNAEDDWTEDLEATLESDGRLWVDIERYDDSKHFHTDMEGLLKVINEEGWEMQDLSDRQKDELELEAMLDAEPEPVQETTYTCKSGYVMKVWMVVEPCAELSMAGKLRVGDRLKSMRGWFDNKRHCFIVRSRRDAETLWNEIERGIDEYDREESRRRRY